MKASRRSSARLGPEPQHTEQLLRSPGQSCCWGQAGGAGERAAEPSPLGGCVYLMRGPSSVSAVVSAVVPAIATPLVSVPLVALWLVAAAAAAAQVLLVGRLLRLHSPVPPVAPTSELLLPADTPEKNSTLGRTPTPTTAGRTRRQESGTLTGLSAWCCSKEKM